MQQSTANHKPDFRLLVNLNIHNGWNIEAPAKH
jgi:hypothetical protein